MVHSDIQRHTFDRRLGQILRAERLRRWYTLQGLADAVGVSKRTICYLQNGERAPSVTVAYRILDVLGVDPETGWGALFIAAAVPDVGKESPLRMSQDTP